MQAFLVLSRAVDRINTMIGRAAAWAILAAVLISAINAVVRKVFNTSSNAWLEAQWYLYAAAFLLGAAMTLKDNEHIRIDIVYGAFSRKVQHRIDLFGHLVFLLPFVLLMDWFLVPYVALSVHSGEVSNNAGGLILWPAKALLLAGFLMLTAQALSEIVKKLAVMRGLIPDPHPFVSAHEAAEAEGAALAREVSQ